MVFFKLSSFSFVVSFFWRPKSDCSQNKDFDTRTQTLAKSSVSGARAAHRHGPLAISLNRTHVSTFPPQAPCLLTAAAFTCLPKRGPCGWASQHFSPFENACMWRPHDQLAPTHLRRSRVPHRRFFAAALLERLVATLRNPQGSCPLAAESNPWFVRGETRPPTSQAFQK